MSDAAAVVEAFLEALSTPEGMREALASMTTEDLVWANTGLPTAEGREACTALIEAMVVGMGLSGLQIDMVHIAANGNAVLTERIDRFLGADGKEVDALPVMGTFEVRDGRIAQWRDYFDGTGFMQKMAAASG